MSYFDFSRPKMFDVKKRLGNLEETEEDTLEDLKDGSGSDPWVELNSSRGSLCSSIDPNLVMVDEQGATTMGRDSRQSPVLTQSPPEFENLEQIRYKMVQDMIPPGKNTDWIWDWSSRPEVLPTKSSRRRNFTPPNSPVNGQKESHSPWSISTPPRSVPSKGLPRSSYLTANVLVGFIVSNIVTLVIGAAIGYVVCKRLVRQRAI